MNTVVITLGVFLATVILLALTVMYTGVYNVAAGWQDPPLVKWVLYAMRESSIERRAQTVQVPNLDVTKRIDNGFRSYRNTCVICHASPDEELQSLAKGLNPQPPKLSKEVAGISDAELFWVIKNGIRMTGMPAWGLSHSDEELWDIVAFLRHLPDMSAEEYQALNRRFPPGGGLADDQRNGSQPR